MKRIGTDLKGGNGEALASELRILTTVYTEIHGKKYFLVFRVFRGYFSVPAKISIRSQKPLLDHGRPRPLQK